MLRLLTWVLSVLLLLVATREWEQAPSDTDSAPSPPKEQAQKPQQAEAPQAGTPEETVVVPLLPSAEQVEELAPELRVAQTSALKTVMLGQTLRLVREQHRLTPENLRDSADAARMAGAPLFWQQAMRALASGSLSPRERRELENRIQDFYRQFGVDALALRLFVETSGLSADEINDLLPRLPMEPLFNLPPQERATAADLAAQAGALKEVFSALMTRLESVHDKDSADAAADALIPFLSLFDRTQQLRLSGPKEQVEAFSAYRDFFPPAAQTILEQRLRLHNAAYFSSPRLRALNYFLQ